jgi:DNA-binding SARP family transcriptional activator
MTVTQPTERGLALRLLGSPEVKLGGLPIEVDTRKAIALLVYLAVTRRPHGRDALAALLWPEYDHERARAALRRTLSVLKKALGGRWVDAGRGAVALEQTDMWVDVHRFVELEESTQGHGHAGTDVCAACVPPLRAAASLYRADFLTGFSLRDSAAFDDWQFFQAEGWRRMLAGVLDRLGRALTAAGELEEAIDHARRWLSLDPLHEPAHRMLMRLYAWSDRRSAALQQYRECVAVLDRELGVAPLEETAELNRQIAGGDLPAPRGRIEVPSGAPAGDDGGLGSSSRNLLVGRDEEVAGLLQLYRSMGDDGCLVGVEGEAGIGKTAFATEALARLEQRGAVMLRARCYEEEAALPYGPVAELLRAALGRGTAWAREVPDRWLGEAARLVPELADLRAGVSAGPNLEDAGARRRLFEGVTEVLVTAVGGNSPGVLFVDDMHWSDRSSLNLITYLARRLEGKAILLLGTWRTEGLGNLAHLQAAARDAARQGRGLIVRLGRLSPEAVRELAGARAPGLDGSVVERLFEETQGLPLFVSEYLAAVEEGADSLPWPPPSGVRDLVAARVATLSEAASQVLAAAAVIGSASEFETLRRASGRSEDEAVMALEELIRRGLLQEGMLEGPQSAPSYSFAHEVVRALVYDETGFARRRLLHARVARALVGRSRPADAGLRAGQAAHHFRAAGNDEEAARWFVVAGEEARRLYANGEALAYFDAALALGYPDAGSLHEAIGDLRTLGGDYEGAARSFETAAARSDSGPLGRLEHKLGNVLLRSGDPAAAEAHFAAALESLGQDDAALRARVLADRSLARHREGDDEAAARLAHEALVVAEGTGDTLALAQVHNILGILATGDVAVSHLEASLGHAERSGDVGARVAARNNLALAEGARGNIARALEHGREALRLCSLQGDRHREAALENNLADLLHAGGQSEAAMAHLKRAVALFAEVGEEPLAQPELWRLVEW